MSKPSRENRKKIEICPCSYRILAKTEDLVSTIQVVDASDRERKYITEDFSATLKLLNMDNDGFALKLEVNKEKESFISPELYLTSIERVERDSKNKLLSVFLLIRNEFRKYFQLKFREVEELERYYNLILDVVERNEKNPINCENNLVCKYIVRTRRDSGYSKFKKSFKNNFGLKISNDSALVGGSSNSSNSLKDQFYNLHFDNWNTSHFGEFLKHIFVHPKMKKDKEEFLEISFMKTGVVTLFQFLEKKMLLGLLLEYYKKNNCLRSMLTLMTRKKRPVAFEKFDLSEYPLFLKYEIVEDALFNEISYLLINRNGRFEINFYMALTKQLKMDKNLVLLRRNILDLDAICRSLRTKEMYLWDIDTCANYLFSMIFHEKTLEDVLDENLKIFTDGERRKLAAKTKNWNDEFQRSLDIDPELWSECLRETNEKLGVDLANVCWEIRKKREQNKKRIERIAILKLVSEKRMKVIEEKKRKFKERLKILSSQVDEELIKKQIEELKVTIRVKRGSYSIVRGKYLELLEDGNEKANLLEPKMEDMSMTIDNLNEKLQELETSVKNNIVELSKEEIEGEGEGEEEDKELQNLKRRAIELRYEIQNYPAKYREFNEERVQFLNSDIHKKEVRTLLIQDSIKKLSKNNSMRNLSVKLILSIKFGLKPGFYLRTASRMVKTDSQRWGLIHAYLSICNIQLHFLSNGFVRIINTRKKEERLDGYEEILAIDCNCPLILHKEDTVSKILMLAREIVSVNVNNRYQFCKVWKSEKNLNCQTYCLHLLKILKCSSFFPSVKKYLSKFKKELSSLSKHDDKTLRFFKYNHLREVASRMGNEFKNLFPVNGFEGFKTTSTGRILFENHSQLDEFYILLLEKCPDFKIHFPGMYLLLKAFDRAFWIQCSYSFEDKLQLPEKLKMSPKGCPFVVNEDETEKMELSTSNPNKENKS